MSGTPFDAAAISKAVHATLDSALATIPPGKRGALLMRLDGSGETLTASATVAAHINDDWQIAGGAGLGWSKTSKPNPSVSFAVMGAW